MVNCKIKGKDAEIYFIFEHKSRPDNSVLSQILKYVIGGWQRDIKEGRPLTSIIPVVFYSDKRAWKVEVDLGESFKELPEEVMAEVVRYRYQLIEAKGVRQEELKELVGKSRMLMTAIEVMRAEVK